MNSDPGLRGRPEAEPVSDQLLPIVATKAAYLLGRLIGEGIMAARRVAGAVHEFTAPGDE